jgi:hypothetical protein
MKIKLWNYWTLEKCKADAFNFLSRKEWQIKSGGAYQKARRSGWLDVCCAHMRPNGNIRKRLVYVYMFSDKSIYFGYTCKPEERKSQHLNGSGGHSSVFEHIEKTGLIPIYYELTSFLEVDFYAFLEKNLIALYRKKKNWNLLNKTDGGECSGKKIKWTLESCFQEALKHKTIRDWYNANSSSVVVARRNGWMDVCTMHMDRLWEKKWTLEICKANALNYKLRSEWAKKSKNAYTAAMMNGWLDECCAHMINPKRVKDGHWTLETCKADALKYKTKTEWRKYSAGAANAAWKKGWWEECCMHFIKPLAWNKEFT